MYEERGEEGGDVEGEGPALHIPGLVGQQLVFVVPLERGGRRGGELAVEGRLLVPQHHLVLGGDHGPGEALICREEGDKHLCDCIEFQRERPLWPVAHGPSPALLEAANSRARRSRPAAFRWRCVSAPRRGPRGDLMRSAEQTLQLIRTSISWVFFLPPRPYNSTQRSFLSFLGCFLSGALQRKEVRRSQVGSTTLETGRLCAREANFIHNSNGKQWTRLFVSSFFLCCCGGMFASTAADPLHAAR